MQRPLLAACLGTLLSVGALPAQMFVGGAPPGAMPLVTFQPSASATADPAAPTGGGCMPAAPQVDPATTGTQVAGKQLARAIATVTALPWLDDLDAARVESAATGKPILWLQALGELDGFA